MASARGSPLPTTILSVVFSFSFRFLFKREVQQFSRSPLDPRVTVGKRAPDGPQPFLPPVSQRIEDLEPELWVRIGQRLHE